MIPLLTLPDEIARSNFNATSRVFSYFENNESNELDDVVVTKTFDGEVKSRFGDEIWDFSAYIDRKISTKNKLFFSEISDDNLAREFKLICFAWIYAAGNARKQINVKPSTIIARHAKLIFVFKYLDTNNFASIELLSKAIVFHDFCDHVKKAQFSVGNIGLILNSINHVQRLSKILPIKLVLPHDGSQRALVRSIAAQSTVDQQDQFYAIPTRLMENLYSHCMSQVELFYKYREDIHNLLLELRKNYTLGKTIVDRKIDSGIWTWLTKDSLDYRVEVNKHKPCTYKDIINAHFNSHEIDEYIPRNVTHFYGWLSEIQMCCFIVCAAFTGMRRSEVYGIHANSFKKQEFLSKTFSTLESTYHKMTQSKGVKAEWVTIPFVEKAVDLAEAISRHLRHQLLTSDNPMDVHNATCLWLGQKNKSALPKIRAEGNMRKQFYKIAKKADLYVTEQDLIEFDLINPNCNPLHAERKIKVGELWPITSHQFRRTFAVFAKRHNLCSSVAIKQQFKHLDLPTSEWYEQGGLASKVKSLQNDKELSKLLEEVQLEFKTQKIHSWYNSSVQLYGKMGASIVRERNSLPQIYKSWDAIYHHVKNGRLNLVGTIHSYCMAGYECKMNNILSPANCSGCENRLIDNEKALHWKDRHAWCMKMLIELESSKSLTHSIYSHFITQMKAAEKVMKYFKIKFDDLPAEFTKYEQI